jgi:hypothetical protein
MAICREREKQIMPSEEHASKAEMSEGNEKLNILDWIDVGKVSAERDANLSKYFYDNGILAQVIANPAAFLILGRKGAGKTAVFKYLTENPLQYIKSEDILVPLSLEDYNWKVHQLLESQESAASLAFKQSWRFVLLVETVRAVAERARDRNTPLPNQLKAAAMLLERLFDQPLPGLTVIIGRKLLGLSKLKLPKGGIDLSTGDVGSVEVAGGEVEFSEVEQSTDLRSALSSNIERVIDCLSNAVDECESLGGNVYICFDRVDEAWDEVSVELSKRVIAGLIGAADSISHRYDGVVRPIIFLREDIFSVLPLNDANKLREDCGSLLKWDKASLEKLLLQRINYFGSLKSVSRVSSIDLLFEKKEMRQRTRPFSYLLKRSMMRPRDLISFMSRIIDTTKEKANDPFAAEDYIAKDCFETEVIYEAEPGYSEWLKEELFDEWKAQYPIIRDLLNAIQNLGSTNFRAEDLRKHINASSAAGNGKFIDALRFLFENSIIGFKTGASSIWKFKCFYPSQGFVESDEYHVHDGLVRALNLKEPRGGIVGSETELHSSEE